MKNEGRRETGLKSIKESAHGEAAPYPQTVKYIMIDITKGREHGLQGFETLLLVIVRV